MGISEHSKLGVGLFVCALIRGDVPLRLKGLSCPQKKELMMRDGPPTGPTEIDGCKEFLNVFAV